MKTKRKQLKVKKRLKAKKLAALSRKKTQLTSAATVATNIEPKKEVASSPETSSDKENKTPIRASKMTGETPKSSKSIKAKPKSAAKKKSPVLKVKISPSPKKIREAQGSKDSSFSRKSPEISCYYCLKVFTSKEMLRNHAAGCEEINKLETKRDCQHCGETLPLSQSYTHEVFWCKEHSTKGQESIVCPSCGDERSRFLNNFKRHLSTKCLDSLIKFTAKSLDNSTSNSPTPKHPKPPVKGDATKKSPDPLINLNSTPANHDKSFQSSGTADSTATSNSGVIAGSKTCYYCSKTFMTRSSLRDHASSCPEIAKMEPKRDCDHCGETFSLTRSYLHELLTCKKHPTSGLEIVLCPAPNCGAELKRNNVRAIYRHMCKCLDHLVEMSKKSLDMSLSLNESNVTLTTDDPDPGAKPSRKRKATGNEDDGLTPAKVKKSFPSAESTPKPKTKPSGSGSAKCPYCDKFVSRTSLENYHFLYCEDFNKLEPTRKCNFCTTVLPAGKSYMHEARCLGNPGKLGPNNTETACPKCQQGKFTFSSLQSHLSTKCLEHLVARNKELLKAQPDSGSEIKVDAKEPLSKRARKNSGKTSKKVDEKKDDDRLAETPKDLPIQQNSGETTPKRGGRKSKSPKSTGKKVKPLDGEGADIVIDQALSKRDDQDGKNADEGASKCPFCLKVFKSENALKQHPISCLGIKIYEPKKPCHFCKEVMPLSLGLFHELICSENRWKNVVDADNLKTQDILCPVCKEKKKACDLPKHLSTCAVVVKSIMDNAILSMKDNPSANWIQPNTEDLIEKANLTFWLQE